MSIQYHVYGNDGAGGPIDYTTVLDTVAGTSVAMPALADNSVNLFGVRAFDTVTGLEEQNTDAFVRIVVGPSGQDLTLLPSPPRGLRVVVGPGGTARVEWSVPELRPAYLPTGCHVYLGTGSTPSYGSPVATVGIGTRGRSFVMSAALSGLSDGVGYAVGVRCYSAVGEEQNTVVATFTASSTGPLAVSGLTSQATY